jgi:hypothetical protein
MFHEVAKFNGCVVVVSIYHKTTWGNFFNELGLHEGLKPYIIGDKGYPLHSS